MVKYAGIYYLYTRVRFVFLSYSYGTKILGFRIINSTCTYSTDFNIFDFKELYTKSFIIAFILTNINRKEYKFRPWWLNLEHLSGCTYKYAFFISDEQQQILKEYLIKYYPFVNFKVIANLIKFSFTDEANTPEFRKTLVSLWKMEGKL